MKKLTSGKISIAALAFSLLLVGSFFAGKFITKTYAHCGSGCDGWVNVGSCVADSCGSSIGKQQQSKTTPGYTTPKVCEKTCVGVTEAFSASHTIYASDTVSYGPWGGIENGKCPSGAGDSCEDWKWSGKDYHHTRTITHACPTGYTYAEQNGPDDCYKTETFSATIIYGEKSNDPNKCHKETPVTPSIPPWASNEFNALPQTKNKIDSTNCTGGVWIPEVLEYRNISCNSAPIVECPCSDRDSDGVCDSQDNCPSVANPAQEDTDGNGVGNACEEVVDACPLMNGVEDPEIQENIPDGYHKEIESDDCVKDVEPTSDLCLNIDGIQYEVPEGLHINATGVECVAYGTPGVEQPSNTSTSEVLGTSTASGGQVLGASTMAGTGSFDQMAYQAIMVLGGTLSAFGIKNFKKASKKA